MTFDPRMQCLVCSCGHMVEVGRGAASNPERMMQLVQAIEKRHKCRTKPVRFDEGDGIQGVKDRVWKRIASEMRQAGMLSAEEVKFFQPYEAQLKEAAREKNSSTLLPARGRFARADARRAAARA